ncbi:unnamed protein product [Acanthoscelides obtectus]|uniref:Chitin-binding type-2 domain-containing protein n=1 Tax=Acanthoscelides obtectus TaxID=200917 RepID=A0A9P0KEM4_ACAOB|nr:unnamed protein product [Acanthoscelides obtectus]CAK1644695.1 hypothetical protein AOBTE_LOCUS13924 [Acanthoscelides obtectus]
MGDSNDCTKFYRCVNNGAGGFIKYEFSCAPGTVWDQDVSTCNYPGSVAGKCGLGTSTQAGQPTQQAPQNQQGQQGQQNQQGQGQVNQQGQQGQGNQQQNQQGQNNQQQQNQQNQQGQQGQQNQQGQQGQVNQQGQQGQGNQQQNQQGQNNQQQQNQQNQQGQQNQSGQQGQQSGNQTQCQNNNQQVGQISNNVCTAEGFAGDQNDCKKFYRCVNNGQNGFTKYEFTCGEGTVWDSSILSCNHPYATPGKCGTQELSPQGSQQGQGVPQGSGPIGPQGPGQAPSGSQGPQNSGTTSSVSTSKILRSKTKKLTEIFILILPEIMYSQQFVEI